MNFHNSIHTNWKQILSAEFEKSYCIELENFVSQEYQIHPDTTFPQKEEVFNAYNSCSFDEVKVVILGQDPYPTKGNAHGLCFSVQENVKPFPKSLNNIFKELNSDIGKPIPDHGNLQRWANQGVFLLNTILTVYEGAPMSHARKGWEKFTDATIKALNAKEESIVFLLWGSKAIAKSDLIDQSKHHILTSVHPSPLSAYRGFFGCKHFSQTNELLGEGRRVEW